jgi:hypothetical protein
MSTMAAPLAAVNAELMAEPSGLIKATVAPAPKAPKAGTTVMGLTKTGGVGGTGGTGGTTGVTGVTGATTAVEDPPPQPTKKAMGNTSAAKSFEIFMMGGL